jgi:hypothetical protein
MVFFWHDPAHVLVGTCMGPFASRRPKPFGAFLTQKRHSLPPVGSACCVGAAKRQQGVRVSHKISMISFG